MPFDQAQANEQMKSAKFYHDDKTAFSKLKNQTEGTFLLRPSRTVKGAITLSYVENGQIRHLRITNEQAFQIMSDYTRNQGAKKGLNKPAEKSHYVNANTAAQGVRERASQGSTPYQPMPATPRTGYHAPPAGGNAHRAAAVAHAPGNPETNHYTKPQKARDPYEKGDIETPGNSSRTKSRK